MNININGAIGSALQYVLSHTLLTRVIGVNNYKGPG